MRQTNGRCARAQSNALANVILLVALGHLWVPAASGSSRTRTSVASVAITVNSTSDAADLGGLQQVGDLPGPDGRVTLREAAIASTNTPGPETIGFDIPTSDPGFLGTAFEIRTLAPIVLGGDGTVLDGMSQPGGHAIALMGDFPNTWSMTGLIVSASHGTVRGLRGFGYFGRGLEIRGDGNVVEACSIMGAAGSGILITGNDNLVGGMAPGVGCWVGSCGGSGIVLESGTSGNMVQGNTLEGNGACGLEVDGVGHTIGGSSGAARNRIGLNGTVNAQGNPVWPQLWLRGTGHVAKGNWIGVDATGMQRGGWAAKSGVLVNGALHEIGGAEPGAGNLISGHDHPTFKQELRPAGIRIVDAIGILVKGNWIGTDATGTAALPNQVGIRIEGASSEITIGGPEPGDGNRIAFNLMDGVAIKNDLVERVHISGNSTFGSGRLGIDLGDDPVGSLGTEGVTSNDPGDVDTGANHLQNFPAIAQVVDEGPRTTVQGHLDTVDPQGCAIELFSNETLDPSGFGEGRHFHGRFTPDADGRFTADLPGGLAGRYLVATATDALGNTSEFSLAVRVEGAVATADPGQRESGFSMTLGPNPLRDATRILLALAQGGDVDLRVFDVLGHEVTRLASGWLPAGHHAWTWNGRGRNGNSVPAGVYHLHAMIGGRKAVRRLVLLR